MLCSGDISMSAVETVTEVISDRVFGLGHSMLAAGRSTADVGRNDPYHHSPPIHLIQICLHRPDSRNSGHGWISGGTEMGQIRLCCLSIFEWNDRISAAVGILLSGGCQSSSDPAFTICNTGASRVYGDFPPEHSLEYDLLFGLPVMIRFNFPWGTDSGAQAPAAEISADIPADDQPLPNVEIEESMYPRDLPPAARHRSGRQNYPK